MAQALVCATPGQETISPVSGVINTYYPGGAASLSAGATSLSLGARDTRGSTTLIAPGDLVLVIQMQDGTLNTNNNSNYGNGSGSGQGTTSMGSAGRYEFVRADSVVGTTVTFSPALTHTYVNANAGTDGQKRYQVIRVPQYTSVTMNGVQGPAWNGSNGGVVVADATGTLTLGSATVEGQANSAIFLAGRGFRGGAGITASANGNDSEWRSTANANGIKGEGIAGTARRVSNTSNNFGVAVAAASLTAVDSGIQGYPNGDYARGAPGNAGGGGTEGTASPGSSQRNAGGGGGGNFAAGGLGGRPWNAPLNDTNGRGGAGYAGSIGFNRLLLGGGGGAGGTNNGTGDTGTYENSGISCAAGALCSSGASGGGIVILRARTVTGAGVIDVRGAHGYNVLNDAAGGGGAGGSVVLQASQGGSANVDARGGDGGNAWAGNTGGINNRHGPGGGGGGGFVAFSPSNFAVSATLTGGRAGRTSNGATDTYGSNGNNGGQNGFAQPDIPGVTPGADCFPDLRLAKTNNGSTLNNGDASDYVLTVSNVGGTSTSGITTVVDVLPTGITVANGVVPLTGAQAANWTCNAASNVLTCTSITAVVAAGSSVFGFTAQVTSVPNGSSVTNRARVGGGGDPNKPAPDATTTAECTGNNTPAGCAIDVDTVNAPLLSVVKTDNSATVVTGGTTTYQLTVANTGASPTVGTIRVVDVLPVGMTYTGVSPFSSGQFDCTYSSASLSFTCESTTAIANGSSVVIAIPATVAASTTSALTNRAQVGGGSDPGKITLPTVASTTACPAPTSPDINNSNVATGCAADTNAVTNINLALEKDDGQPFMPINGQTTYQFRVRNSGTVDSIGSIQFRDVLPTPMNWPATLTLAGPNAADWACTRVSATVVSCASSVVIAAGNLSNFSLVANVGAATSLTQYTNRARISGGGDADLPATLGDAEVNACTGNNVPVGCAIDLNTAQNAAQVRLAKTHVDPQSKQPGDSVTFNLVVSNSGGSTTSADIRVVDVLPTGISYPGPASFTSGGFACTHASGVITCDRNNNPPANRLAAGQSVTISFLATVSSGIGSGVLVNRAQVGGGGDPQLGSATSVTATTAGECSGNGTPYLGCAVDPVPVVLNANLAITKSNAATSVTAGTEVTYTLVVSNAGPAAANGAAVRDPVSAGLNCTTANCGTEVNGAMCPVATGPALVSALQSGAGSVIGTFPASSAVTFTLTCTVTATGSP